MTLCGLSRQDGKSMSTVRSLVLAFLLLSTAALSQEAASPSAGNATAATLKRASARCRAHANLDACYDAIRWSPGDSALLVALGDALVRARRPEDAIRSYRRAAALAPNMPGVAAKISAAEAKLASRRAPRKLTVDRASVSGASGKRYSNAAPEAQSH
jgi:cytochrome c-type biogenesis protein CcmH/NrfG